MTSIDPIILFFIVGVLAGLMRSELRLPAAIYDFLSVLLLLTIGLKGGVELAKQSIGGLLPQVALITLMGVTLPLIAYPILRALKFKRADAASIAAHYGSVSVGTFAVAVAYLTTAGISYEAQMPLFLVVLEVPAIIVGITLAKGISAKTNWRSLGHEVFTGKSIMLLLGGLFIGWAAGSEGLTPIKPFFFNLFHGVLALFLMEMGLIAASQSKSLKKYGITIAAFGILMPLCSAFIGIGLAYLMGLSLGGTILMTILAASSSYIAVPAAMRISVPEANPTLSLTASLGITFPFNILIGIPLYHKMAEWLLG